jgi:hypothetical protein
MHPYEHLSLFTVGMVLALSLIGVHSAMLLMPDASSAFLKRFPRNHTLGQILLGLGLAWFWLLIAPENLGMLSALAMDLGEFNGAKPLLRILIPVAVVLISTSVRDFLAVRALGVLGLMTAAPILEAAFLEDPRSRLLLPIYAYLMLTASLFCVGMPYLFRDLVNWITAEPKRWRSAALAGLGYGIAVLACALSFWRGY